MVLPQIGDLSSYIRMVTIQFFYKAENIFASDERYIYFFSDAPHLLKTVRSCFSNTNSHKNTRKMWKSGLNISWMHIVNLIRIIVWELGGSVPN